MFLGKQTKHVLWFSWTRNQLHAQTSWHSIVLIDSNSSWNAPGKRRATTKVPLWKRILPEPKPLQALRSMTSALFLVLQVVIIFRRFLIHALQGTFIFVSLHSHVCIVCVLLLRRKDHTQLQTDTPSDEECVPKKWLLGYTRNIPTCFSEKMNRPSGVLPESVL